MGNNNSTPSKEAGDAPVYEASMQTPIKRYHSVHGGSRNVSAESTHAARHVAGTPQLLNSGSVFNRTSSHDGSGTPKRERSRSGSVSAFFGQRKGSAVAAPAPSSTTSTAAAPIRYSSPEDSGAGQQTTLAEAAPEQSVDAAGLGIEGGARTAPRTRRVTEGLPPTTSTDARSFVPPQPSPSVAMQAHYAAGMSSHHAGILNSNEVDASSNASAEVATALPASSRPNLSTRASNRHPLFGIEGGNNNLYVNSVNSAANSAAASPLIGGSSPILSPQTPAALDADVGNDGSADRPLVTLPSYLKIPTAIPSAHVQPSSPPTGVYTHHFDQSVNLSSALKDEDGRPYIKGSGSAAAAILDAVDVVIKPGNASRASSPTHSRQASVSSAEDASKVGCSEQNVDAARAAGIDVTDLPVHSPAKGIPAPSVGEERQPRSLERNATGASATGTSATSRTPTPTPSSCGPRALTPTNPESNRLRSLSPGTAPATSVGAPSAPISARRPYMDVQTGGTESGYNTPLLPPGLTSAPPSASTPAETPLSQSLALTPAGERASSRSSKANSTASTPSTPSNPAQQFILPLQQSSQAPLMPIVLTWRAGGKEVFVTGTFANEWRSKILLHKSKRDHTCVLHLAPGTHRLKFIVDDRWRVSRELPTATDGDGNLVNYVEIPNVGPAHPGPLSAPGEDFPESNAEKPRTERNTKLDSKRTTMNLVEEARRAEAARLDDFFDEDRKDQEEMWTSEIPISLIEAQEAEEALREAQESEHEQQSHDAPTLPNPPALPRQLEKVILNSSPANPNNGGSTGSTVDDNSILPAPNHVVLNHLTASSIKGGVLAVGTTTRYKRKYVTTVYYRPVQV